jgi:hypothetical protein
MKSTKQHPKYWLNQGTRYQFRIWNVQVFAQNMGPCFPWPKTRFAVTCLRFPLPAREVTQNSTFQDARLSVTPETLKRHV